MNTEKSRKGTRFWLTVVLMGVIFVLLVMSVGGPGKLLQGIAETWPIGVLGVALLYTAVMSIRVIRWKLLLLVHEKDIALPLLGKVAWIAWAQNAVLPARLGEVSRLLLLKEHADVPYSVTTASILLEKFFDLFGLLFVLATSAILFINSDVTLDKNIIWAVKLLGVLVFIGSLTILSTVFLDEFYLRLIQKLPLRDKLTNLFSSFRDASKHLMRRRKVFVTVLLSSVLQWFVEALTVVVVAATFGVFNLTGIIFASIVGYASYIFPVTPGSLGPFELFVGQVIIIVTGIDFSLATKIPFITHILVIAYLGVTAMVATLMLAPVENRENTDETEQTT